MDDIFNKNINLKVNRETKFIIKKAKKITVKKLKPFAKEKFNEEKLKFCINHKFDFKNPQKKTLYHKLSYFKWINRYYSKLKPDYVFKPEDKMKSITLKQIFKAFDSDNSNTLELEEFLEMFIENYLENNIKTIVSKEDFDKILNLLNNKFIELYKLVTNKGKLSLNLFLELFFHEKGKKLFENSMIETKNFIQKILGKYIKDKKEIDDKIFLPLNIEKMLNFWSYKSWRSYLINTIKKQKFIDDKFGLLEGLISLSDTINFSKNNNKANNIINENKNLYSTTNSNFYNPNGELDKKKKIKFINNYYYKYRNKNSSIKNLKNIDTKFTKTYSDFKLNKLNKLNDIKRETVNTLNTNSRVNKNANEIILDTLDLIKKYDTNTVNLSESKKNSKKIIVIKKDMYIKTEPSKNYLRETRMYKKKNKDILQNLTGLDFKKRKRKRTIQ